MCNDVGKTEKKDVARVVRDFIKTYLAGTRKDVFSVFENFEAKDMLKEAVKDEKENIFKGLKLLCGIKETYDSESSDIESVCARAFGKSKRINFFTSDSSSIPKNCIHSQEMIKEETEGVSFLFSIISRIVSTVPSHHSYGFIFGLQLSKLK